MTTTRTLFIELRDPDGVTEVWEPSAEEMAELGWVRREPAPRTIDDAVREHVERVKCESVERGASCRLFWGHSGPHEFNMLDADPVQVDGAMSSIQSEANGDECPWKDVGRCRADLDAKHGKLISERVIEVACARLKRKHGDEPADDVIASTVNAILDVLDERLGRAP